MTRLLRTLVATTLMACTTAFAAPVLFNTNPFTGSTADPNDGIRTIFGGVERQLPSFNIANDRFVFDSAVFALSGGLHFTSGLASALPSSGVNVVVLQTTDNDNDPATNFLAGTAATLIANAIDADGPGFFIYHNSALLVNRLVYSTNLNSATADLSILARITSPTSALAIAELPNFTADNFTVPEPGTWALAMLGLGGAATARRRVR